MLRKNEKKYFHSSKLNISSLHKKSVKTFRILVERVYFELFDSFWRYESLEDSLLVNAQKPMKSMKLSIITNISNVLFAKWLLALSQTVSAKKYLRKLKNKDSSFKNILSQYLENVKNAPCHNYLYEYIFSTLSAFHLTYLLVSLKYSPDTLKLFFLLCTLFEQ